MVMVVVIIINPVKWKCLDLSMEQTSSENVQEKRRSIFWSVHS